MSDHGIQSWAPAVLLLALLLALAGVLRWDLLKLWWQGLFTQVDEHDLAGPQAIGRAPQAPRRLHESALQHQAAQQRPAIHRSGRRG